MRDGAMRDHDAGLEGEIVDGEPVEALPALAEVTAVERRRPAPIPAIQTAAAAATGFVAGAATVALLRRHGIRRLARESSELGRLRDGAPARTYLIRVRLISRPDGPGE
jgi:hypothetical protein